MELPGLLLCLAAGLGVAPFLEPCSLLPAVPLLAGGGWWLLRRRRGSFLLLALALATLGTSLYQLQISPPKGPARIESYAGAEPVTVRGKVLSLRPRDDGGGSIDLEAEGVRSAGEWAGVEGRLRLVVEEGMPQVRPGQSLLFRAKLRAPRVFGTPGEFDYVRHLAFRRIFATAFVAVGSEVVPLAGAGPSARLEDFRFRVGAGIDRAVSAGTAPLVRALVIGDQAGMSKALRELLARGGVSHLFAISGLHFGLVAAFLYLVALAVYRRSETLLLFAPPRRALWVPLLPVLFGYLLFTGAGLPTRRAFMAVALGAILILVSRRTPPLRVLASVAFLLLILEPLAFFEPSFQLSFAGVTGILVLLPRWRPRIEGLPRGVRQAAMLLAVTLAATLATTPLVLWHFHLLAPAGLLTNLLAVPAVGFLAVPLGLAGGLLFPLWPWGAGWLWRGCAAVLEGVLTLVERVVALPGLGGRLLYLSPSLSAAVALGGVALLLPGGTRFRRLGRVGAGALAALLLAWPVPDVKGVSLTVLSVGHGDAMLLSLPGGRHYLVDGGGLHGERFDVGERLLAPALGRLGVRRLEGVILTHDHPDHRQGLCHLLEQFPVRGFVSALPREDLHESLREALFVSGVPHATLGAGWHTLVGEAGLVVALRVPPQEGEVNDRSVAVYFRQGDQGGLLTGDLEGEGVEGLLGEGIPGPVTLLKLPHHGSRHSRPELLLDALAPQACFVSVGYGNPYRLPAAQVVTALEARKIPLFRTDLDATLRFETDGQAWRVSRWRRGLFR